MNLLSINNVAKIGREQPLFTGVTFGLDEGHKAALIGKNGTGKSTLLATIAGVLEPDDGTVVINKSAGVSYLPQNPVYEEEDTIREHIFKSKSPKLEVIREYEDVCEQMAHVSAEDEPARSSSLQNRFEQLTVKIENDDLWNYESQVRSILSTLGIADMNRKMKELSGGMIKKVALAQVLVEDTKLLLLDEPTNHLDITTISWLQEYLAQTKRSVLMVTHDRYFLDAVCNHIYELDRNRVKLYIGNYSTYLEKKATEAEIEANTERRIESVLRFERDWLLRGPCARGTKAKARKQHDEALINREKFTEDKGFTLEVKGRRLGGKILELHHITKNFHKGNSEKTKDTPVIKNFNYTFNKGEKIGIFGDNGTGKSTLLNIITGAIEPDEGNIVKGINTAFAYYQQNPVFKDTDISVLEYIKEAAEVMVMNDGTALSASLFLEQFGFTGRIQHSPLSSLSGGERKRLFLVRLLLSNPNFIILDEPTNDFDIFTMNILEQFLQGFNGCLLVVSHDRYFMDKICDTLFILEDDGSVSGYVGKCSEYIEYRKMLRDEAEAARRASSGNEVSSTGRGDGSGTGTSSAKGRGSGTDISYAKGRGSGSDISSANSGGSSGTGVSSANSGGSSGTGVSSANNAPAKKRKMTFREQKEFEQLETDIASLEDRQSELEAAMSSTDYTAAQKAGTEYKEVSELLEQKYSRWEELASITEGAV